MRKYRVRTVRAFRDASTGELHKLGSEMTVTEKRLAELNACGPAQNFVPLVETVDLAPDEADGADAPDKDGEAR